MNIRTTLLMAGLAASLAGCVVTQRTAPPRDHDYRYDDYYYDYHSTPSYEGYYYVRIIFIRNVPYYVDDNRYIRPIPRHLHDHFRKYPYHTLRRPPVFSRDTEVRDGYPLSRIIYMDGTPYHVEDNRIAQPVPERLQQRFRYPQENMGRPPQASGQHDNSRNNEPPAYGRERDQERVRERDQEERAPNGRGREQNREEASQNQRERMVQPPFERRQRRDEGGPAAVIEDRTTPFPDQRRAPVRQEQPAAAAPHDTPASRERNRTDAHPQAAGDRDQRTNNNGKKSRSGKDEDQQDKGRGNGNRNN